MRLSDVLGRQVFDASGAPAGRIVDLVARPGPDGTAYVTSAVVAVGRRGRLVTLDRPGLGRPWLIHALARPLHGTVREVPLGDLRFGPGADQPSLVNALGRADTAEP